MFALTASLVFAGLTNTVSAQSDPYILLTIAKRAQEQIQSQITSDSSLQIKELFNQATNEIDSLERSISENDMNSAKEHFLSTMKIFSEISRILPNQQSTQTQATKPTQPNPSNDLLRMYSYANNLKIIAKNHNSTIDFSPLDELFVTAKNQIKNKQFKEASQTIHDLKNIILEINAKLRQQATQQESNRAQIFAEKYLKQLDRLIEHAQITGQSENIIQKLESARDDLLLAESPSEVIEKVRNVMLLQQQFELTENKLLELRILKIEKTMQDLDNSDKIEQETLDQISQKILNIKNLISKSEFEQANELLRSLSTIFEQIQI